MKPFRIPISFHAIGRIIKVKIDHQLIEDEGDDGQYLIHKDLIKLQSPDILKRPMHQLEIAFFHEVTHCTFHVLREYELRDNEKLVEQVGATLHQIFTTMEYED